MTNLRFLAPITNHHRSSPLRVTPGEPHCPSSQPRTPPQCPSTENPASNPTEHCQISTKGSKYGSNSTRAFFFFFFNFFFAFFFFIILLPWKPASSNCINANNFPSFKAAEVRDQILASAFQAASQTFSDSLKAPKGGGEGGGWRAD